MTSEERIDELEKKVRIMAMANDNLRERSDNMSAQLAAIKDTLAKIYGVLELQDKINQINMINMITKQ